MFVKISDLQIMILVVSCSGELYKNISVRPTVVDNELTQADPQDLQYAKIAWEHMELFNEKYNAKGDVYYVPNIVLKAEFGYTKGERTRLLVEYGESRCRKAVYHPKDVVKNCDMRLYGKSAPYIIDIWKPFWRGAEQVITIDVVT